jgi:L-ascorbate metabolism protein UlaG (beta-lactamase superfamily)
MDAREAAAAVEVIRPRVVVPMHRYQADTGRWARHVRQVSSHTAVAALGIGEPLSI